jgi:Lrp/AsnC family transcriptional regulator for asnA, asnC and gidA
VATFDPLDLRIIARLQDDGRLPFTTLAGALGVSEATIRSRVSRLTRRGVLKFVADVDPRALGLVYGYVGVRVAGAALKRAVESLVAIPETITVAVTAGSFDAMVEFVCVDTDDMLRILQDDIRAIPGVVSAEAFTVLRLAKDQWQYAALETAARRGGL